jgi:hypothetical protein
MGFTFSSWQVLWSKIKIKMYHVIKLCLCTKVLILTILQLNGILTYCCNINSMYYFMLLIQCYFYNDLFNQLELNFQYIFLSLLHSKHQMDYTIELLKTILKHWSIPSFKSVIYLLKNVYKIFIQVVLTFTLYLLVIIFSKYIISHKVHSQYLSINNHNLF